MSVRAGSRLRSTVCETEVIVVRPPGSPVDLRCGGHPMAPLGNDVAAEWAVSGPHDGGTLLGKRYADPETGLELLCTRPGDGSLSLEAEPLLLKDAKPLPSSD
jgi:hypothetical protein